MIHNVWVISKTGLPMFSINYRDIGVEDSLIVGFLTALQAFAKEVTRVNIESVRIGSNTLTFTTKEEMMVVLNADPSDNNVMVRKLVRSISEKFIERYGASFEGGEVNEFADFRKVVDSLIVDNHLRISCSKCGKDIESDFIEVRNGDTELYYCCQSCKNSDRLPNNVEVMYGLELRCGVCGESLSIPTHCGYPMSPDGDNLACWMGRDCRTIEFPSHCGSQVRIEVKTS